MTIINALPFNFVNGTTADATQVDANFSEVVTDVNNNAAHNGTNTDITALAGLTTPITPAQGGTSTYFGQGAGTANVQTVPTPSPSGFALNAGDSIYWLPLHSNTGSATLAVNSTAATLVQALTEGGPVPLIGGEIIGGQLAKATYDGVHYILDADPMAGFGTVNNLVSATTTDLGTALSHSINITGTTTITSFGSSANTQRPLYKLVFSGALTLTYNATSLILPGSGNITTANGDAADALYLGSGNWQILAYYKRSGQPVAFNPVFIQNYISGLTLSTAGGSGTFGIAAGVSTDSTNAGTMLLSSAYTKTTASWVVGSGNGALDTGAIAGSTWYHVFLIQRTDTGVTDILFSLSASAPTMPTSYTLFRRIGSMKTDGSNHWLLFTQTGDTFIWSVTVSDTSTAGTSASTFALAGVPTGVVVNALGRVNSSAGGSSSLLITSLQESDQAASIADAAQQAAAQLMTANVARFTNTSAQLRCRASNAGVGFNYNTYGWIDTRGKS